MQLIGLFGGLCMLALRRKVREALFYGNFDLMKNF